MHLSKALILLAPSLLLSSTLSDGWDSLYTNAPNEALSLFRSVPDQPASEKASALRGEAEVLLFLGKTGELASLATESFKLDSDIFFYNSNISYLLNWSRSPKERIDRSIIRELKRSRELAPFTTPQTNELLITKYLSSNNQRRAQKVNAETGIIRDWHFIGSFENSAGSGYNVPFAPEQAIISDSIYTGKNQNEVSWNYLEVTSEDPWIRLENHGATENGVWYFASSINSPIEQDGYLSFGASAQFKIFQNGVEIVGDSLFKNTGLNSFLTEVTLEEGVNTFLLKVGSEYREPNFAVALLDNSFTPFENVRSLSEIVDIRSSNISPTGDQSIMVDSLASYFKAIIDEDSSNLEAVSTLISLYMIHNRTEEAETIISTYLEKYPESGYLLEKLATCYSNQGRLTEAKQTYQTSYNLCKSAYTSWAKELLRLFSEGNKVSVRSFINNSVPSNRESLRSLLTQISLYASEGKIAQAMEIVEVLREDHSDNLEVIELLYTLYAEGGVTEAAEEVLRNAVDEQPYNLQMQYALGEFLTKNGNSQGALDVYGDAIKIFPMAPRSYYLIAVLLTGHDQFEAALPYINKTLELTPNSAAAFQLKGRILQQLGMVDEATICYEDAIRIADNDFVFWESLRELQGKPSWHVLAPLPDVDSLIDTIMPWVESVDQPVTILTYVNDIFRYPSRAIRDRTFWVINLGERDAVDKWQEYQISYSQTQSLEVLQAATVKQDGSWIPADRNRGSIVFKSLEPGDNIVLEYTLQNYKTTGMKGMIYGEQGFATPLPTYNQTTRFITPVDDTIPYAISGDSVIAVENSTVEDFAVTTFTTTPDSAVATEKSFIPDEYENEPKIIYSDFKSWNEIARWYSNLTASKSEKTSSVLSLADSLYQDLTDPWEKLRRTHQYISDNIVYSYVPFRQSGWIPQSTSAILATKIGDCKDMALLGRTLLRLGGIEAELILVNTKLSQYLDNAFVGPNFDHAILSATIGDSTLYIDLTSNNSSLGSLPAPDQGAMALTVNDSSESVFMLPFDSPEDRLIERSINIDIDTNGTATYNTNSIKSGIYAASMRNAYRYKSDNERVNYMRDLLQEENQGVKVDSLIFEGIDSLGNSVSYQTDYTVENAASVRSNSVVFRAGIPDQITTSYFPQLTSRKSPISFRYLNRMISNQKSLMTITYPESWELVTLPETESFKSMSGEYEISYTHEDNRITIERSVTINYNKIYLPEEFSFEHEFLSKISFADDIELIFTK